MKKVVVFIFVLFILTTHSYAQTCTANPGGGDWDNAATWDCGIVPDGTITNIVIPAGVTVTIPFFTPIVYNGQVSVYGTLFILVGGSLVMDASSSVDVFPGGSITGLGFGGPFTPTISVGGTVTPITLFTPVNGPATVDVSGNGPLPITLIFFNAELSDQKVNLTWATATEENFDYFSIERSVDGENFKEIAQIQGLGESFERVDYAYVDEFPLAGISYYRLRSIDFDGYTEVFDYKMVDVEGLVKDFSVFPNPVTDGLFSLQTNFVSDRGLDLLVYNNVGKIEASFKVNDWLSTYDISNLQPGSYLIKLATPDGPVVKRILVK